MKSKRIGSKSYKAKHGKIKGDTRIQFFTAKVEHPIKPATSGIKILKL